MKVYNITNSYINNNYKNYYKPAFTSSQNDTFVKSSQDRFGLKAITSKTAQLLYGMDYIPQSLPEEYYVPEEGYYTTYALDKKTLKPVDIYVSNFYRNSDSIRYHFYKRSSFGTLINVGSRQVKFNDELQKISPSDYYMFSRDESLLGVGLLEHQIAVEEMLKRGYKNVEINAVQSSYDFHRKAGFISTDYYVEMKPQELTDFVQDWSDRLKVPESTILDLLVFKHDSEVPILNVNKTLEKILLYIKENGISCEDDYITINMELSPQALEEWKQIIARKTILIDTNFHPKV